jgi:phospholipid/cholesterol/gamma-HCH transport system substrate-binding protein
MIENKSPLFDYTRSEITAGVFVLVGLVTLGYLSMSVGGLRLLPRKEYHVRARFSNIGDLKPHAPVKIAGVTVGRVDAIHLQDFVGEVQLGIGRAVHLPKDTIASITTAGLLGDAYVSLSPGGSDVNLKDGDPISQTEPALNMSDLVGRAAFGNSEGNARGGGTGEEPAPGGKPPGKQPTPPASKPGDLP